MIRFWVNNRLVVNLITAAVIILGILFSARLKREIYPPVDYGYIFITTTYPGATPEVIETAITIPIENAIADVSGVKQITSVSSQGLSFITIQANSDVQGPELDNLLNDLKNEVDTIQTFPTAAKVPIFRRLRPEFPVVTVAVGGAVPEETLRSTAERLDDEIEALDGISTVDLTGYRNREIHVLVDPRKLAATDLSLTGIADSVMNRNVNLPAGTVNFDTKEMLVRTSGETPTAADFGAIILRSGPDGVTYLRDIAKVADTFEKETVIGRLDGHRSISLAVTKTAGGDVIGIVKEISDLLDRESKNVPKGTVLKLVHDRSVQVQLRQRTLLNDGVMGLLLVVVVINLFLGYRFAIWAAMSIPFSFLATFIYMYLTNTTMNLFSMFGLLLALGEVADNAIVVTENYFRYRQMGYSTYDAATIGTDEIVLPVVASKATNIASLIPLLMLSGITGTFLRSIPEIAIVTFIISGLQAFFILPSNLNQFVKVSIAATKEDSKQWFLRFREFYGALLGRALAHRYAIFIGLNVVAVITILLAALTMRFVLTGQTLADRFTATVSNPVDTNLDETDRILRQVESLVPGLPKEDVAALETSVGRAAPSRNAEIGDYTGAVTIDLTEHGYLKTGAEKLASMLSKKTDFVPGPRRITYTINREGPPTGSAVSMEIRGDDFGVLEPLAEEVMRELHKMKGVTSIDSDFRRGQEEYFIGVDEYQAKKVGLSAAFVGNEVYAALSGARAGYIYRGIDTIQILVEYPELLQTPLSVLNFTVPSPSGGRVPIRSVTDISKDRGILRIHHSERKRTITVSADVVTGVTTSSTVNNALKEKFGTTSPTHPGYYYYYKGEYEDTQDALRSIIQSFFLALGIMFIVLTLLFKSVSQPFIIMLAIPFAFIGVVFGLFIMGIGLSLNAVIGVVALMGIVVNNSILLVDFVNRARAKGSDIYDAIIDSGKIRLRPIVLTSLTTLLGLFPMAFGIGGEEPYLAPMAISMFWGVLFSTLLTLFIVPCLYLILEDIKQGGIKKAILGRS